LQIEGRVTAASVAPLIGSLAHALAILALYLPGALTPFRVVLLTVLANSIPWLVLAALGRREGLWSLRVDRRLMIVMLRFGLKVQFSLVFFFLLLRLDQLFVRSYLGYHALGLYALAT